MWCFTAGKGLTVVAAVLEGTYAEKTEEAEQAKQVKKCLVE